MARGACARALPEPTDVSSLTTVCFDQQLKSNFLMAGGSGTRLKSSFVLFMAMFIHRFSISRAVSWCCQYRCKRKWAARRGGGSIHEEVEMSARRRVIVMMMWNATKLPFRPSLSLCMGVDEAVM